MKPIRLRDFVKFNNCYFAVVSYFNEGRVKCLLRYIPLTFLSESGNAKNSRGNYVKLSHEEALRYFKEYIKDGIFLLPAEDVEVYKPEVLTPQIAERDEAVREVWDFFSSIPSGKKGVTGSRLVRLNTESSDVDFVVYGRWWFKAREKLKKAIESGELKHPSEEMWIKLYEKRKPAIDFKAFVLHETRKYHRAVIGNIYFDLLYSRDYDELHVYPEVRGRKVGMVELKGVLKDDSAVFDYPARYPLVEVESSELSETVEVLSFTHTYVGQAFKGETVRAYGCLEATGDGFQLIVGTRRESPEYIVSESLLRGEVE